MRVGLHLKTCLVACKFAALLLVAAASAQTPQEPVYAAFAKTLAPFASALFGGGEGQPGAFVIEGTVSGATGVTSAAQGMQIRLAVQHPDSLRADVASNGQILTACRTGRELWATPEEPAKALAQAAGIALDNTAPDAESTPLVPLALDAKILALLPAAFDVKDEGNEDIEGAPHRVLRFSLLPNLRKASTIPAFEARVWIHDNHQPRRLAIKGADYSIQIEIARLSFAPRFPDKAWQPEENQSVLRLPASVLNNLLGKMLSLKTSPPAPVIAKPSPPAAP